MSPVADVMTVVACTCPDLNAELRRRDHKKPVHRPECPTLRTYQPAAYAATWCGRCGQVFRAHLPETGWACPEAIR